MFLVALLPKTANEQLQEWKLKLVTDLGPLEGASPVIYFTKNLPCFLSTYLGNLVRFTFFFHALVAWFAPVL